MADPSTPAMGPGGGPIDTWKIRGIIAASIGEVVDASDIARARDAETDDGLRQMLTVALGLAGDRGTVSELVEILHHHPDGCMRENAAYALYRLKANVPRAVLQARMSDRYAGLDVQDVGPPGISKVYPVREAVAALLRASGEKVDRRAYVQERPSTPIPEALSWLFEDKDPQVCLTTAQVLGQYGQEGLSYLRAFVEQNEGDETLKEAVEEARRILEAAETREDSASAPSAPAARADQ